jgi:hypothetical protein
MGILLLKVHQVDLKLLKLKEHYLENIPKKLVNLMALKKEIIHHSQNNHLRKNKNKENNLVKL